MATPLGQLLSESWQSFRRALVPILIGALLFGIILGIGQSFVGRSMQREAVTMLQNLGIEKTVVEDLIIRIGRGDEVAVDDLAQTLQTALEAKGSEASKYMGVIFLGLWKTIGVSLLLFWAVTVLASALFIVLALKDDLDFLSALQRVPALVLPLVGLSLWIIIRSFVWVPFIGPILGVVLLPRLLCAPVVLVDEHKGVLESAKLSYERTRGYWGKIFGNMVVAAVCAFIGAFILTFVIGVFGEQVSVALAPVVNMLVTAFSTVFMVKLSLAVMRHPKGAVV